MLHTLLSPITASVEMLRDDWHEDKTSFWLLSTVFAILAILVVIFLGLVVVLVLALTGVIPLTGGGSIHTGYHPGVFIPVRGGMIHVG